jgi:hypothetical protein
MTVKRSCSGWGWDWDHKTKGGQIVFAGFDLDNLNRLHIRRDWYDKAQWGLVVEWGNGNSDPAWSAGVDLKLPLWWVRHCERRWERKRANGRD